MEDDKKITAQPRYPHVRKAKSYRDICAEHPEQVPEKYVVGRNGVTIKKGWFSEDGPEA